MSSSRTMSKESFSITTSYYTCFTGFCKHSFDGKRSMVSKKPFLEKNWIRYVIENCLSIVNRTYMSIAFRVYSKLSI